VDQDVGAGLEGTAGLAEALGVYADPQLVPVCRTHHRGQRRVVENRRTVVQHDLDQVVSMRGSLVNRAYAVGRSRKLTHSFRRGPCPVGGVSTNGGQKRSSDLDQTTSRRIDLPAASDTRHPTQVVDLNDCRVGQCGGIHQSEVDMPVNHAGHDRAWKPWHAGTPYRGCPEGDRAQSTIDLLEDRRPEPTADP